MNNLAFQIYGTKKAAPFQSVWDTRNMALGVETANRTASSLPSDWALAPGGTNLLTGGYTHNGSGSNNLSFVYGNGAFQNYQIECRLSAGSTGSVVINLGNVSSASLFNSSTTIILTPTAGGGTLSITPVNFVGTVSLSVKQSSSAANQIQLPITSIPVGKSIWIDWGDGQYSTANSGNVAANRLHTYTTAGEYPVRVFGDDFSFGFGSTTTINDRLKIKSISSWGKLKMGSASFNGCSNMTMSGITDIPDLTGVTSLSSAFTGCLLLTTVGRINEWNMTSILTTASMFSSATSFNQSLSSWERAGSTLANVTDMQSMFSGATVFNGNLSGWDLSKVRTFNGMFQEAKAFNNGAVAGAGGTMPWTINTTTSVRMDSMFYNHYSFNQDIGSWNVSKVTNFNSFLYHDNGPQTNTFNNGYSDSIKNWNVSACTVFNNMFVRCRFNQPVHLWDVSKAISMDGMFNGCTSFNNGYASGTANQLPWNINTESNVNMSNIFNGCTAFNSNLGTGTTPWNVSKVTSFAGIFSGASKFNNGDETTQSKINDWAINTESNVSMASMFSSATAFNRNIGSWNVSNVTAMNNMFYQAYLFNQPVGNWNVSNVTTMGGTFASARLFNQDISKWNVGKVTVFTYMFYGNANTMSFNNGSNLDINPVTGLQGIDGWNINTSPTASVSMEGMFIGTNQQHPFNRPIGSWNVSRVTTMGSMFSSCSFNQPLANWERVDSTLANVTNMNTMFQSTQSFNQDISSWNVSNVTNMQGMFYSAAAFNQDISKWNVSKVTNMAEMFRGTIAFTNGGNSDTNPITSRTGINGWNTSEVTNMNSMFSSSLFNQIINSWNVSKVNNFGGMFGTKQYTQPLNLWNIGGDSSVTTINMASMFLRNGSFNQDISMWSVSKVTNMSNMFYNDTTPASTFNQPIGSWDVSNVTNMSAMFYNAFAFNQPIGDWNVSKVTNFASFMTGKTPANFSKENLDAIYNGWIVNGVQPNISSPLATNISFGGAKYTADSTIKREELIAAPNNWRIVDGGITTI